MRFGKVHRSFIPVIHKYTAFVIRRTKAFAQDDIYQELLIAVWKAWNAYDPFKGPLTNFMTRSIHNRATDLCRESFSKLRVVAPPPESEDEGLEPSYAPEQEALVSLRECLEHKKRGRVQRQLFTALTGQLGSLASEEVLCRLRAQKINKPTHTPGADALASFVGCNRDVAKRDLRRVQQALTRSLRA